MKIFNYNTGTGALIGHAIADESPMEPGTFIIPFGATAVVPPVTGPDQTAVFRDGAWSVVDSKTVAPTKPVEPDETDEQRKARYMTALSEHVAWSLNDPLYLSSVPSRLRDQWVSACNKVAIDALSVSVPATWEEFAKCLPNRSPSLRDLRAEAYREESDPIFFKEQRGEVPAGTWLASVAEIKARYPVAE